MTPLSTTLRNVLSGGATLLALAVFFSGCGRPSDEAWLRFLGFRESGGTTSLATLSGDLYDGESDTVDAAFQNHSITVGATEGASGTGILVKMARVEYTLSGFKPPSADIPLNLYLAPGSVASGTVTYADSATLAGLPLASASLKAWLIATGAFDDPDSTPAVTLTARVTFFARTDEGTDLEVSAGIGIVLATTGTGGAAKTVNVAATRSTASLGSPGKVRVSRGGGSATALTVYYTAGGTATAGSDYETLDGYVVIPAGSADATISVVPISGFTANETVIITLTANDAYTVGSRPKATVTLATATTTVNVSATTATATTSTPGIFTVSRDSSNAADLTVYYTIGGTATAGTDYLGLDEYAVIPAWSASTTISVTPITGYTAYETVTVTLEGHSPYTVGSRPKATVTLK